MARNSTRKKSPGRPREGKELRQFVGANVAAISKRQLEAWVRAARKDRPGYHVGRALDELVDFSRRRHFQPPAEF